MRTEASSTGIWQSPKETYLRLFWLHYELQKVLSERTTIFIGQDVSVEASGQKINPFFLTRLIVKIPEGYFSRELGEVDEQALIRWLLHINQFSVRSKLAQGGIEFKAAIPQGGTAADIPITQEDGYYKVPLDAFSQNPKLGFKLPKDGEFPVFRFMIYPFRYRLGGVDLLKIAESMGANPCLIELVSCHGRRTPLEKCSGLPSSSRFLSPDHEDCLYSMAISIERWARFKKEKEVDLEVLNRAKLREEIDQVLGLDWKNSGDDRVEEWFEYMIGETPKVIFPPDTAGVINIGYFNIKHNGRAAHSDSVLIDPGFGETNGGMPIRTEHVVMQEIGQPRKAPKFLELFFFKANC